MSEPLLLPELARSLRAFGAPRGAAAEAAHTAIFAPLLDARARAGLGDEESALSALRGETLAVRIQARVDEAARAVEREPAHARARAARASELVEPLRAALEALDPLAARARGAGRESPHWSAWILQLRRVFTAADDACRALATLLEPAPAAAPAPRRWFGR